MASNVLLIGSGGREHALATFLAQCKTVKEVFVTPGNGGTAKIRGIRNINLAVNEDFDEIRKFVADETNNIQLVVVGPEVPLVNGLVDVLNSSIGKQICFGPTKAAARLEGSKAFAKDFMKKFNIPTAEFKNFYEADSLRAKQYLQSLKNVRSVVIKYSGLAAGKGVFLPESIEEAFKVVEEIFDKNRFGNPDETGKHSVVIEERLIGEEVSVLCLCDGTDFVTMPFVQDYKRVGDDDEGPNTGGMGAHTFYKSEDVFPKSKLAELRKTIDNTVIKPSLEGCVKEDYSFSGVLYAGLMLTENGPKLLEYNCRFGDPETQVILPLLDQTGDSSDLFTILKHCAYEDLKLRDIADKIKFKDKICATLVSASAGYPGEYGKGKEISGLENFENKEDDDVFVFQAGTQKNEKGEIITSGGRVLCTSVVGEEPAEVLEKMYTAAGKIKFEGKFSRFDIGCKMK